MIGQLKLYIKSQKKHETQNCTMYVKNVRFCSFLPVFRTFFLGQWVKKNWFALKGQKIEVSN